MLTQPTSIEWPPLGGDRIESIHSCHDMVRLRGRKKYMDIYGKSLGQFLGIPIGKDCWEEEDDIYKLEAPFTEEEVKNAIWSLGWIKHRTGWLSNVVFQAFFGRK